MSRSLPTLILAAVFVGAFLPAGGTGLAMAQQPTTGPTTSTASEATAHQAVEQAIASILGLLKDKSLSADERANGLDAVLRQHMNLATLSRLMLGKSWDQLPEGQRSAFIEELSGHLMGVYLPMTDGYSGQDVRVTENHPEPNGDHTVLVGISDVKGDAVRKIATLSCRMRRSDAGWKAIDLRVEGISVAVLFGAQFRPVVAREGFDALIERLRQKNAQGAAARVKH